MGAELNPPVANQLRRTTKGSWRLLRALPGLFKYSSIEWINDNAPRLGASVAFYTLLSLAPVIIVAVAVAAVVYGEQAAQGRLALEIEGIAGPDVARNIQGIIKGAYQPRPGAIATVLGLVTLVFGATSMFVELHDALNTIWGVSLPLDRSHAATIIRLVKDRFYSFASVTSIGFILLLALVLNAWVATIRIEVSRTATFVILYLVVAVLFATLFKIVPDVSLKWSDVALGALITALLFMLGKQLMGLYFAHTNFVSSYGAAASPIVVLLWVYYSAQIFFWGVEFSKVYTRTLGSHSTQRY